MPFAYQGIICLAGVAVLFATQLKADNTYNFFFKCYGEEVICSLSIAPAILYRLSHVHQAMLKG